MKHLADASATAERTAPVTPLQRGLFFQAQMAGPAGHYVAQSYFTFDRRLDTDALAEAMAYVIARHPVVGAGFTTDDDGNPVQVLKAGRRVDVRTVELSTDAEVDALRAQDRDTGFDPGEPPLIRLTVVRLPGDRDGLLLSYHLLLWDGWSREIVLRDLFDAYEAVLAGEPLDADPGHAELRGVRPGPRRQGPRGVGTLLGGAPGRPPRPDAARRTGTVPPGRPAARARAHAVRRTVGPAAGGGQGARRHAELGADRRASASCSARTRAAPTRCSA